MIYHNKSEIIDWRYNGNQINLAYNNNEVIFGKEPIKGIGIEDFNFNYNFKNYDSATQTVPNDPNANWNQDLVLQGTPVVSTDHITVTNSDAYAQFPFSSTTANIFNRNSTNGYEMTIIFKVGTCTANGENDLISNRGYYSNGGSDSYGWMARPQSTYCYLHDSGGQKCGITYPTKPNIVVMTLSSTQYLTNRSITNNTSNSGYISISRDSGRICFFCANFNSASTTYLSERFNGVCYWMFQANRVLTDSEINDVIIFNETL